MNTVQKLDIDRELEAARQRANRLAGRRVRAMQQRLYADGAADRAVLGIAEPWRPATPAEALGLMFGLIGRAVQGTVDGFNRGVTAALSGEVR